MGQSSPSSVHVIGGGLAGSEAAWQLARRGVPVVLHEMRPGYGTEAHQTDGLAELVCSNSFRSDDAANNAIGLLHEEMRRCGSLIMAAADGAKLPAGAALAVDRHRFSEAVTNAIAQEPLIELRREAVDSLPPEAWDSVIVATGPLTSPGLAEAIQGISGEGYLAFFDAIAPIVYKDSIDFETAWYQSRYDKVGPGGENEGSGDYINCPLDQAQYEAFIDALLDAETTQFKTWEADTPYFEGCLPIEVMASRGRETLRYGPMKPVGLTDPRTGRRPYAVVQLRQDNALGTLYNLVGFQTKIRYKQQVEMFRMIPGLENAEFARLGGLHRNTFINSPRLLDDRLRMKVAPRIRFAGQITGVEGYVESAAVGILSGRFAAAERLGEDTAPPPPTTALGALLGHITGGGDPETFQPMNVNFGLFPPIYGENGKPVKRKERKPAQCARALADLDRWLAGDTPRAAAE
ncbi:methylenetetrahydrofolate--tRNA-(uracil(54)-C(5))-methyltransferase (FADH(2)-oxidizing) TrmFO [Ferruginivarius sediminum]|uniref:Methylenetetrahydrofolate--tRNA-(uracil-5-)-methyltransferase TrmFO n=1 Tax=Ferruginivarius sediminum TaxID=2661937 RepID=A0A369T982_9PROT|nr:methylenetetrahydrofolate--tRNA-(uracil(54)-C(5))-methyltransferase (FADH(2)-oxidizing) TrmFO [Ferruginivarius sediminum]RDD61432.1 methylenetetrahydrofolate--tRNA-(uracil(54)-C(5))-methyltransferase (FADH(2)-oxidizing) TrmFO [Ferruginivarius sediminum]